MHLGSSASWAPFYPYHNIGKKYRKCRDLVNTIDSLNVKWDEFCHKALYKE